MKKLKYTWLSLVLFCGNCALRATHYEPSTSITINFSPAFNSGLKISIRKEKNNPILSFAVMDLKTIIAKGSVPLAENDWTQFISAIDTSSLISLKPVFREGMDGIGITVTYSKDTSKNSFYCWSPQRQENASVYKLLDPTFKLLYEKLPNQENRIEDVQDYLEYGLPVKTKSLHPFIAKLYGGLSTGCEVQLQSFFNTVPTDSGSVLDLSTFHSMGTLLYPYFKKFDLSHPKVIWVVSNPNKNQLTEAGLDKKKMVSTLNKALARVK